MSLLCKLGIHKWQILRCFLRIDAIKGTVTAPSLRQCMRCNKLQYRKRLWYTGNGKKLSKWRSA